MTNGTPLFVAIAAEGRLDLTVARRLLQHVGAVPDAAAALHGKSYLRAHLAEYNRAERSRNRELRATLSRTARGMAGETAGYVNFWSGFVADAAAGWRPDVAAERADSLRRCIVRLSDLVSAAR